MFCPVCRAEYRPGFTRCSDCDVGLIHERPEPGFPVPTPKRDWMSMLPTVRNTYRHGRKTVQLALAFNRHPFHALGSALAWGRVSHLVGRRTRIIAMADFGYFFAGVVTVCHSRELCKENREAKSSSKRKASGKTAKVSKPRYSTHLIS